jgi:hypothetical protein
MPGFSLSTEETSVIGRKQNLRIAAIPLGDHIQFFASWVFRPIVTVDSGLS